VSHHLFLAVGDDEKRELRRMSGRDLYRVVGDVYAPFDEPFTLELRCAALQLLIPAAVGPGAVVGLSSAAWLYCGAAVSAGVAPEHVEVLVEYPRSRLPAGEVVLRQARLPAADVWCLHGLRVTTPLRTAADVACFLLPGNARAVLRQLRRAYGVEPDEVRAALEVAVGRRGVVAGRRLVAGWQTSVLGAATGDAVGVEDAVHLADGGDHMTEVRGVAHLERELADGHPVA